MHIPPRQHLARRVQAALAPPFAPPLYLHGPASTGKQSTLRHVAPSDARIVEIDCILHHTDRRLFSAIIPEAAPISDATALLDVLRDGAPTTTDGAQTTTGSTSYTSSRFIVIFSRAERLASSSFPASTLPFIFQLPILSGRSDIRVALVSRVPFSTLRHAHSHPLSAPTAIFFPPLSEVEVKHALHSDVTRLQSPLLSNATVEEISQAQRYYDGFSAAVVDILYSSTNNPHHLQRVTDSLFPEYFSALTNSKPHNPTAAFNRVRDRLNNTLSLLSPCAATIPASGDNVRTKTDQCDDKTRTLPCVARVLLVSAYLGTVIAPTHDMRHFSRERAGRRAGTQKMAANNAVPLERLFAIYRAVRPDNDDEISSDFDSDVSGAISTAALIHISTLVTLGWLVRDSGNDPLAEPKFRCKLSRDEAVRIAGSCGMQIHDYLVFDKA